MVTAIFNILNLENCNKECEVQKIKGNQGKG
jgi:hypothetical protein